MLAIETIDLTKAFGTHLGRSGPPALDSLHLEIEEKEIFGFLGKNGSGKTTTIKLLCGLLRPTRGTARICGVDARTRSARRLLGYLPENPYFYEYLTPRETIAFYGRLDGLSASERAREWDTLSELLNLREIADQRLRGFSKGMRQRLGFAVALVGNPSVLILDEPMSGLDPLGRRMIRDLILHQRDAGKTIFFSSHVLGDVERICDRVGILVDGRLTTQGRIDSLLDRRVQQVEIIAREIAPELTAEFDREALSVRRSEDGYHVIFGDLMSANAALKKIHNTGGVLVEFLPLRESLEDYFIREQDGREVLR